MIKTTHNTIHIDGSQGEGGGQILRSSLALSMVTKKPFRISRIRAGRAKPGLLRQHLTGVNAAAAICGARVEGASLGSQELAFTPSDTIKGGAYHFPIGSAGGTMLVVQAILPALLRADGPSTVIIEGGTHNVAAPPFEFVERTLIPTLNLAGACITARLERHGFYPAGGGRIVLSVEPTKDARPLSLLTRGERVSIHANAIVSQLSRSIAEREVAVLCERLGIDAANATVTSVPEPRGPGNAALVELRYDHITEVFCAFGELGKGAEVVARELADDVRQYIAETHPVGEHLADQLMVPLAVLAGGRYATGPLSPHARTNMDVLQSFGAIASFNDSVVSIEPLAIPRAR
jgi:RNA 3'-terminal phosphate cyclase (ATP)